MDWIVLRKIIAGFVLPPAGPILLVMLGLVLLGRYRRAGKTLAWLGACTLLASSLPVVSTWLVDVSGGARALDLSRPLDAQAIVITGAGVRLQAPDYAADTLAPLTLERARYGAYLAKKTGLPVLVTGGVMTRGMSEAALMWNTLQQEYAVPVRWIEAASRNTRQNARFSAAALLPQGIRRVVVVTHAFDVRRARMEFESAGLQVISAPTGIGFNPRRRLSPRDFVPAPSAFLSSYYACYELAALAAAQLSPP